MAIYIQKQTCYSYLTPLRPFMAYEAMKRIALSQEFNNHMFRLKKGTVLEKENNPFLHRLKQTEILSLDIALTIAVMWKDITDHLMQTALKSIMVFSDKLSQARFPHEYTKDALQTGIGLLAEEYNAASIPCAESLQAPADGLNSLWWDIHIVQPLLSACDNKGVDLQRVVAPQVQHLRKTMDRLSQEPLGFMVQLGVIETLVRDIMLAFLPPLTQLEGKDGKIFNSSEIFSWVTDYLDVESLSWAAYTCKENKMFKELGIFENFNSLFSLAQAYMQNWADIFDGFCELLQMKLPLSYLRSEGHLLREERWI